MDKPHVTYEWRVPEQMPVTQLESGRRVTVAPTKVQVFTNRNNGASHLSVYLSGERINRNGSRGGHKSVSFHDHVAWGGEAMDMLPSWALPYVDAARLSEMSVVSEFHVRAGA